jgi:lipopolysaccharide transport system permease protein
MWQSRELLYFLVWRDIKVRYQQTVLGIAWVVLQPLAIALSLTLFLRRLVHAPAGLPYPVFAYSGMLVWQFFSQALASSGNSLLANERLVTKVYFPRLLIPLAAVLGGIPDLAIGLAVLVLFLVRYRIVPSAVLVLLPVPLLLAFLLAFGVGLWLAALNVRYRDVRHTIGFLIQLWFLASPIAYPVSVVPEKWRAWYGLNPMVGIVDSLRWMLHGEGPAPLRLLLISACSGILFLCGGLYYFRRTEDTFADFI